MKPPVLFAPTALLNRCLVFLGLLAALSFPGTASAQSQAPPEDSLDPSSAGQALGDEVVVDLYGEGRPRFALAYPAPVAAENLSEEARRAAAELDQVLREDLEYTRAFDIQGPAALSTLQLTGTPARDQQLYRSLGNELLLLTNVSASGGNRLVFEGRLLDLSNGEPIVGKRYQATFDVARSIAHTFADQVALFVLGRPGLARTSVAFTSDRSGHKELFLMDYDGRGQRRITNHTSISLSPDWHPNSETLIYNAYLGGPPSVYSVDLSTGKKTTLVQDGRHNLNPSFSPDGRRIAFARSLDGNTEIFVSNADGTNAQRITRSGAIDANPSWSPDGRSIAFTSSRVGNPNIFVMDGDGSNLRRLTFEGQYNDGASWNPDGTQIVYASRRNGHFQIAITDVVTLETQVLTKGTSDKEQPSFSPDGRRIVFTGKRRGVSQIYSMDVDGRYLRQLTQDGNNSSPSWSPYPAETR
ncbi:MAG: Tol-Pal system beta propeller repeat protein TolB [Acidobacteriota bacterium]